MVKKKGARRKPTIKSKRGYDTLKSLKVKARAHNAKHCIRYSKLKRGDLLSALGMKQNKHIKFAN